MAEPAPGEVTQLLNAWNNGDQAAFDKLMPLVYGELRRRAKRYMARQPAHTLQTTALIHEAYLRLAGQPDKRWQNRSHFFAVGAAAMRHILVDYLRSRAAAKRGGEARAVLLDEAVVVSDERAADIVALDEALTDLAKLHPRQSRIVECRFFGGLTLEEAAEVLKVSPGTVKRDWRMAKAWLQRSLNRRGADDA